MSCHSVFVVVRPISRVLQTVRNWVAAGSQDRGKDIQLLIPLIALDHARVAHLFLFVQVINNNLNPVWRPFRVSLRALCGGDVEKTIKVSY